jgi:hypothetical protein
MFRKLSILIVFAACAGVPLPTSAQNGLGSIVDTVSRLDRNFDAADRNHDGLLDRDEAKAGRVAFVAGNFDAIDASRRGLVSKGDVHAYIRHVLMQGQPAPASLVSSSGK